MEIKKFFKDLFQVNKESYQKRLKARYLREAKERYYIQAMGDELYVCSASKPIIPFSLLDAKYRNKYTEILDACQQAYVKHEMREF